MHLQDPRHALPLDGELDPIDEASEDSFPASDAPGWAIGQRYPAEPLEAAPPAGEPPAHRGDPESQGDPEPQHL